MVDSFGHIVEVSKSGRARCTAGKNCEDKLIQKDSLRLGSVYTLKNGSRGISWRHWHCVTDRILDNITSEFDSPRKIKGFETLPREYQIEVINKWFVHIVNQGAPMAASKSREKASTEKGVSSVKDSPAESTTKSNQGPAPNTVTSRSTRKSVPKSIPEPVKKKSTVSMVKRTGPPPKASNKKTQGNKKSESANNSGSTPKKSNAPAKVSLRKKRPAPKSLPPSKRTKKSKSPKNG